MPSLPWDDLGEYPEDYIQSTALPAGNIRHPATLSIPDFYSIMNAIRDASESANGDPFIVFRPKAAIEKSRIARAAAKSSPTDSDVRAMHQRRSASPEPSYSSSPGPSFPPALPQPEPSPSKSPRNASSSSIATSPPTASLPKSPVVVTPPEATAPEFLLAPPVFQRDPPSPAHSLSIPAKTRRKRTHSTEQADGHAAYV